MLIAFHLIFIAFHTISIDFHLLISVYPLISKPLPSCIALGLIASGIPTYFLLVKPSQCSPMYQSNSNMVLKYSNVVTRFIQKTTMCVPEELDGAKDEHALVESKIGKENPAFSE